MQITSIFNPGNMVGLSSQSPSAYEANTPVTEPTPNPYNDHADGWLTRGITAGVLTKTPIKLILEGGPTANGIKDILNKPHVQAMGKTVGLSTAVFAGLSLFKQGAGLASGKQTAGGAGANLLSDAMRGAGAGLGSYAGSSVTAVAMKAFGATGGFGTIISMVGGIYGASVGAELVEATGVRSKLLSALDSAA